MCRLCLFNRDFAENSGVNLLNHFWDLETALGGDGNGVACLLSDGTTLLEKGLEFNPGDAYETVQKWMEHTDAEWFMFHTRLATSGGKSDYMCHPFQEGNITMAHNGVCQGYAGFKMGKKEVSDTRFLLHMAATYTDNPLKLMYDASGVFIGWMDGLPFVVKATNYSDLKVLLSEKDMGLCFTSAFWGGVPEQYQMYDANTAIWNGVVTGEESNLKKFIRTRLYKGDSKKYLSPAEYENLTWADKGEYIKVTGKTKKGDAYHYYMRVQSTVVSKQSWGYYDQTDTHAGDTQKLLTGEWE